MWRLHHNYSLKYVPRVYLSFLIFVSSELMSAKYLESNINKQNPIKFQIGIQLESNFASCISSNLNFKILCQVS